MLTHLNEAYDLAEYAIGLSETAAELEGTIYEKYDQLKHEMYSLYPLDHYLLYLMGEIDYALSAAEEEYAYISYSFTNAI